MASNSTWHAVEDDKGILRVTIDQPGRSANVFSKDVMFELDELITSIEANPKLKGVIFQSGKPGMFIAGADIEEMKSIESSDMARTFSERGHRVFSRLEKLSIPTVACISGPCLGGGLEFALSCTYRLADTSRKTQIGLPEAMLGIIPGWGGTVRLPARIGLMRALPLILTGQLLNPRRAKSMGIIDDVVPTEALVLAAEMLIERRPKDKKKKSFKESVLETRLVKNMILNKAKQETLKKTKGHYPAPLKAIEVLRASAMDSPEEGFAAEAAAIGELSQNAVTVELIRLFFLREESKKWAESVAPGSKDVKLRSVGLLGAGTMGAGLAKVMADRGLEVRLKDVKPEFLGKGLAHAKKLFEADVKKKKITTYEAQEGFGRIAPTLDYSGMKRLDLVLEAIVEDMNIKKATLKELEKACGPETIFATNTSSLDLDEMATALSNPERLVGIHFFNPPEKMPLVEIVRGEKTSQRALDVAVAYVQKLGKTPVVVKNCPGFLVNRLLSPYMNEAGFILPEVEDPMEVDRAALSFGMPMGPLKLTDLVGAGVSAKVSEVLYAAYGERMKPAPAWKKLTELWKSSDPRKPPKMILKNMRRKPYLNPAIAEAIAEIRAREGHTFTLSTKEIAERLIFPIINEACRCLDEGIVEFPEQVDLAMVFGTGFAPFRGGPLRYADEIGVDYVVETLDRLAKKHPRFAPSDALRRRAGAGKGKVFNTLMPS